MKKGSDLTTSPLKVLKMCDPGGIRTLDPLIKSQLLYQLSYGVALATGTFSHLRLQR